MNIRYYKGCYSESIKVDNSATSFVIISGMTSHANASSHFVDMLGISSKLIHILPAQDLKDFFEHYISDCSVSDDLMRSQSVTKLSNSSVSELFSILSGLIQSFPSTNQSSADCDGCGDTNFSYEISVK